MVTKHYRETTYGDVYVIQYRSQDDGYHIYCSHHPGNPYSTSELDTHLNDESGHICIERSKFNPQKLDQAKAVAFAWMQGYSQYIRTGRFPNEAKRVHV